MCDNRSTGSKCSLEHSDMAPKAAKKMKWHLSTNQVNYGKATH